MTDDDLTYQIDLPDPDRLTEFSDPVQHYICHVHYGLTFTKIAAAYHSHPSTILRHVRQIEDARDDPLLDQALADLDDPLPPKDVSPMPSIPNAHASKQAQKSPLIAMVRRGVSCAVFARKTRFWLWLKIWIARLFCAQILKGGKPARR